MSAWYWLRLPSGKIVNMAQVIVLDPYRTQVIGAGYTGVFDTDDFAAMLSWVPGQPVAVALPETAEDA